MAANREFGASILRSKLAPGRASGVLARERLEQALAGVADRKLGLVTAGAGYGKTTLAARVLAALERERGLGAGWYALDEEDVELGVFLGYLAACMRLAAPEFEDGFQNRLAAGAGTRQAREALVRDFLLAVERSVSREVVLVLDDFHRVAHSAEVAGAMEYLLERMPDNVHFLLLGRSEPHFALARLRSLGEVVELGERELAFLPGEVASLFADRFGEELGEEDARAVCGKTGGWAAALMLLFGAVGRKPGPEAQAMLAALEGPLTRVFEYLEENVFQRLPGEWKEFMLRTSLFGERGLEPDLCDALLGRDGSLEILEGLARRHLLTFAEDRAEPVFRYHHLLRDFLRHRLEREAGTAGVRETHGAIGRLLLERGDRAGAMRHLMRGGCFAEVRDIVAAVKFHDLMDIPLPLLAEACDRIPEELARENPRVDYLGARLATLRNEVAKALAGYHTALERFQALGDETGVDSCRKDIGFNHYLTGDIRRAREEMLQLWGKPHEDPFFPLEVAVYLTLFAAILGDYEEAESFHTQFLAGMDAAQAGAEERMGAKAWLDFVLAYGFFCSGDFSLSLEMNETALGFFKAMNMAPVMPLAHFQTALVCRFLRKRSEGRAHVEAGLALARELGIRDHQYAWLLCARAWNGLDTAPGGPGDNLAGPLLDARDAAEIFSGAGHKWGMASVQEIFSAIRRTRGEFETAEAEARKGLGLLTGLGLKHAQGTLAVELARILILRERFNQALEVLDQHAGDFAVSTFLLFQSQALRALALSKGGEGRSAQAREPLEQSLALALRHGYVPWLLELGPSMTALLAQAHAQGELDDPESVFLHAGREVEGHLRRLKNQGAAVRSAASRLLEFIPRAAPSLAVSCLGPFAVSVDNTPIPQERWRSGKAATLFKYLALHADQGFTPKDKLLELAWPGQDPERANRSFHVALTTLRKILQPDLERGAPSAHILRRDNGYRLDTGPAGSIDIRSFLHHLDLAERMERAEPRKALEHHQAAQAIYKGPLLAESPYEDWITPQRDHLARLHLHSLARTMALLEQSDDIPARIRAAGQYLVADPCAEPVCCALMRLHAGNGHTQAVLDTYGRCELALADLGLEPDPATCGLLHRLTGAKPLHTPDSAD